MKRNKRIGKHLRKEKSNRKKRLERRGEGRDKNQSCYL
jgi:hypothetical protein